VERSLSDHSNVNSFCRYPHVRTYKQCNFLIYIEIILFIRCAN